MPMTASERWRDMIRAEHAQSDRMRGAAQPGDHWQPYAQGFRSDPSRTDNPLVNRLTGPAAQGKHYLRAESRTGPVPVEPVD